MQHTNLYTPTIANLEVPLKATSRKALASKLNVSVITLRKYLRKAGITHGETLRPGEVKAFFEVWTQFIKQSA